MGPTQFVVSGLLTLIVYAIVLYAVFKIFQISSDVAELKEIMREVRRNTQVIPPTGAPGQTPSAEALIRAVHADYESIASRDET